MAKIMQAQITGRNYGFVFTDSEGQMHMGQKMFLTAPTNPADAIQATLLDGTVTMCDNGADVPVLAYALTSDFNANANDTTNLTPAERIHDGFAINRTVKGQKMANGLAARKGDGITKDAYIDDDGNFIIPAITYPAEFIAHFTIPAADLAEFKVTHQLVGDVTVYDGSDTVLSMTESEFKAIATLDKDSIA